jgi:hypothetical protein
MIKRKGMWVHPKFADPDMAPHTHVIGAPNLQDLASYQSYWEAVSSTDDRLQPRDITMVDESRAYSWWETDSQGRLIPRVSHFSPDQHWELDEAGNLINGDDTVGTGDVTMGGDPVTMGGDAVTW